MAQPLDSMYLIRHFWFAKKKTDSLPQAFGHGVQLSNSPTKHYVTMTIGALQATKTKITRKILLSVHSSNTCGKACTHAIFL